MRAGNTKKSLKALTKDGKSLRHSERDAVVRLTRTELLSFGDCNPETVRAMTAMILGFLQFVLSQDTVFLAMNSAKHMAMESGVPDGEFDRVMNLMMKYWADKKAKNPLGGMF